MKKLFISLGLLFSISGAYAQNISITNKTDQLVEVARIKVELEGKNTNGCEEIRKGSAHIYDIKPGITKSVSLTTATKRRRSATEIDPKKPKKMRKLEGSTPLGAGLSNTKIINVRKINAKFLVRCAGIESGCCEKSFKGVCRSGHDHARLNIGRNVNDISRRYEIVMEDGRVAINPL
ncbi:MAG TPA: hypothetical protein QGF02_00600 [Candidatus Babeliales bacterium]|nr:hypothetical protein [Candidatus Babeliales bacterium]